MELIIKKNIEWKNVYIVVLNEKKKKVDTFKVKFSKFNYSKLVFDLTVHKYIYFTDNKLKSETVILSEAIYGLELRYNPHTKTIDPLLFNKQESLSKIKTYKLQDKINLPHSKNNTKVINVLLPNDYNKNKEYGLLFMLDSQNLFNNDKLNYTKYNDPYGGWQVDTTIENLTNKYKKNLIVVGIETTGNERMLELTESKEFGNVVLSSKKIFKDILEKGTLDKTIDYIVHTVLPFIKSNYNITDFIGIAGSSAGGNAAYYAAIKYNNIFKYSLAFSPAHALFTNEALLNFHKENNFPNVPLYICCGKKGRLEYVLNKNNKRFIKLMNSINYKNIETYYEDTAYHNEILWRYAFAYYMDKILKEQKQL